MSNEYGLTVYNNNGGLMFDTRRGMNSYVVTEVNTGSSPSSETPWGNNEDFVFVKLPPSLSDSVIYYDAFTNTFYSRTFEISYSNGISNTTWGTPIETSLEYFTVKHSSKVSSTDNYGLIVYNEDETIQFDSRSVQQSKHFQITSFIQPGFSGTWSPQGGGTSLGSLGDYWEIGSWTNGGSLGDFFDGLNITGIWGAGNGPYAIRYTSAGGIGSEFPGFPSTTSTETWNSKVYNKIMSAVLT